MVTKRQKTYIREWRKLRKLSQEKVAAEIGVSHSTLGRMERGKSPYNQDRLEAIAVVLDCSVLELLGRDPSDPPQLWDLATQVPPSERRRVAEIIRAFIPLPVRS